MTEPLGLAGDATGDFLQVSGHVSELDPKAADPVGQLVDQSFGLREHGGVFQFDGLCGRHLRVPPAHARLLVHIVRCFLVQSL